MSLSPPYPSLPTTDAEDYMVPWFPREMFWPQAQCLAAYNPSGSKCDKARWAGATGVHCTSNDFTGLYKQWCIRNQPVCGGTRTFCNTTIKPELLQRFGVSMQPSNGKKGNMSAAFRVGPILDVSATTSTVM